MRKKLLIAGVVIVVVMALFLSKGEKKEAVAVKQDESTAVEIQKAVNLSVEDFVEASGNLKPKYSAEVRSEISGVIRDVYVTDWVHVRKGQPLARIDSEELKAYVSRAKASVAAAKAQSAEAQTGLNRAERELERVKNLKASGLATQQQLDDAESEASAAKARLMAASSQVSAAQEELRQISVKLSRTDITAPISGTVAVRNANVGDMAGGENSAAMFTIIDESVYDLNVQIPTVDIAGIKVGNRVDFTVDAYPDKVFSGKVSFINPQVNASDRAVSINISVLNTDSLLKSGYFVKARIYTGDTHNAFLVPQTALIGNDVAAKKAKVYIVQNDTAVLKDVVTGKTGNGTVEIISGIKEGESVVVRGGFTIKNGSKVTAVK